MHSSGFTTRQPTNNRRYPPSGVAIIKYFPHTIVNRLPNRPVCSTRSATTRHFPHNVNDRPIIHDIPQRDTGGSMRPEIDGFSEGCEENLFFRYGRGGSVIVFSPNMTGRSAEALPLLSSVCIRYHNDRYISQASQ